MDEFATPDDLRAEAAALQDLADELHPTREEFRRRCQAMAEKVGAAPFGTRAIAAAAEAVSDATTTDQAAEALTRLRQAIDQAEIADVAAATGAIGDLNAFHASHSAGPTQQPTQPPGAPMPPPSDPADPSGRAGPSDELDALTAEHPPVLDDPAWLYQGLHGSLASRRLRVWQTPDGALVAVVTAARPPGSRSPAPTWPTASPDAPGPHPGASDEPPPAPSRRVERLQPG